MKIWVDDIRQPPDDSWTWCATSEHAISVLKVVKNWYTSPIEAMSLDHDLGGDDTTRPVVIWMINNNFWPDEIYVHSANPVGREWLEGMIERYLR